MEWDRNGRNGKKYGIEMECKMGWDGMKWCGMIIRMESGMIWNWDLEWNLIWDEERIENGMG